ncbi:hypothetical protein GALL_470440 [mine drainage metagenome]|uniref:Uncharacterized protein n=1 Tax=mine drainage metagenome TaxID=410659 RepID=A0A1J5PUC7_9ZZZZ
MTGHNAGIGLNQTEVDVSRQGRRGNIGQGQLRQCGQLDRCRCGTNH